MPTELTEMNDLKVIQPLALNEQIITAQNVIDYELPMLMKAKNAHQKLIHRNVISLWMGVLQSLKELQNLKQNAKS